MHNSEDKTKMVKLAQQCADLLNEALTLDPTAVATLVGMRVPCNKELADHSTVQVRQDGENTFSVGLLGLLNGIIGANSATNSGYLAATYEVVCPRGCTLSPGMLNDRECPTCKSKLCLSGVKQFGIITE